MQRLSRKTTVALITLAVFALVVTVLSYTESSREYFSLWSLFELYLIMGGPVILIFGIAVSYIADMVKFRKRWRILFYAFIASFIMVPYSTYLFGAASPLFSLTGILTAVLFFMIEWAFYKYIYRAAF
ncbi:MAG: hypothetical protein ABS949_03360 [Solibacillus sp.]